MVIAIRPLLFILFSFSRDLKQEESTVELSMIVRTFLAQHKKNFPQPWLLHGGWMSNRSILENNGSVQV